MWLTTFFEQIHVERCNNFNTAIVDGEFPASAAYINVSDFNRFVFLVRAGTLNSALTCQVQQATAIDSTAKDITGAVAVVGAGDDNEVFLIEVECRRLDINNGYNFVTLDVTGAAGGDDYLDILFIGVNPASVPVTQPTGTNTPVIVAG